MNTHSKFWLDRFFLLVALILLPSMYWQATFADRPFNARVWQSETEDGSQRQRKRMVNDLTQRILKKGMTKHQVIALLGRDGNDPKTDEWGYRIGAIYFAFGAPILSLDFDKSNRLAGFGIVSD